MPVEEAKQKTTFQFIRAKSYFWNSFIFGKQRKWRKNFEKNILPVTRSFQPRASGVSGQSTHFQEGLVRPTMLDRPSRLSHFSCIAPSAPTSFDPELALRHLLSGILFPSDSSLTEVEVCESRELHEREVSDEGRERARRPKAHVLAL